MSFHLNEFSRKTGLQRQQSFHARYPMIQGDRAQQNLSQQYATAYHYLAIRMERSFPHGSDRHQIVARRILE
jgi:hypothetical protein